MLPILTLGVIKKVAEFLNSIIDPRSADTVIQAADISEENMKKIQDKLGGTPKLPAKFKEIYQQFKSVKIPSKSGDQPNQTKATEKDLKFYKATYKRHLKGRISDYGCICYYEDGRFITNVSQRYLGDNDTSIKELKKNPGFDTKKILDFINSLKFSDLELHIEFDENGDYSKPSLLIDGKSDMKSVDKLRSILGI